MEIINRLNNLSRERAIDPIVALDYSNLPGKHQFWLSEKLLSIYGTPYYDNLTKEQKISLSQKEFSLLCSVSSYGEKEVVSNVAKIMMHRHYDEVRSYMIYFLKEEINHIHMFSQFCQNIGEFYPTYYSYVQGDLSENILVNELLTFTHVLIFEEIGLTQNYFIAKDESVPELVRMINKIHVDDESRHISFGRTMVNYLCDKVLPLLAAGEISNIQQHLENYINTRHYEYVNYKILKSIGLKNAYKVRQEIIENNDVGYFIRDIFSEKKIISLLKFIKKMYLIKNHRLLQY